MIYQKQYLHGGDVYTNPDFLDFSVNLNPLGIPKGVKGAMEKSLESAGKYPDPFCRELVLGISEKLSVPAEDILCGNGAAELIYSYCEALRPLRAAMLSPSFSEYEAALSETGCEIRSFPLKKERDFLPDPSFLSFLKKESPDVVFLCTPNNPDGRILPKSLLEDILAACERQGTRVFLDECFLELSGACESFAGKLEQYKGLLILKSFTKDYAIPGIRLGYCLSKDHGLLRKMAGKAGPWNVSVVAQAAGRAALLETDYLIKAREIIERERTWLFRNLTEMGFYVCPSEANYLLFQGPLGLFEDLKKYRILIRNCETCEGLSAGWYRICVHTHDKNEWLIEALNAILSERNG